MTIFAAPPGVYAAPTFDAGWMIDGERQPYLSYVTDAVVNWSEDLELLHEESSRTHFLDRWTREAILAGLDPLSRGATIADLGCSTGYLLEDLRAAHPDASLIGVDFVATGLRKAHELVPTAQLLQADVCALPIADESLDAVVSANLLEHLHDDRLALSEIDRVLRVGTKAVVVVPAAPTTYDYYDRFLGHERRYGRHELAAKAGDAGLRVLEDRYLASLLYPAFWLVKQRNRRRYAGLEGDALADRVAADIARTEDSRIGAAAWRVESAFRLRLPFGIRNLVVMRKDAR